MKPKELRKFLRDVRFVFSFFEQTLEGKRPSNISTARVLPKLKKVLKKTDEWLEEMK